jgi:alkaline phosphatase D
MATRVKPLAVGPIVGATTPTSTRLWGRGAPPRQPALCHGLARLRRRGRAWTSARTQHFKMLPHFDFTGTTDFTALTPDTAHDFQIGYVHRAGDWDVPPGQLDWSDASSGSLRTPPSSAEADTSFVFGSCRYLLRVLGGSFFDTRGDKTFRSILEQIERDSRRTDFLLMVGDQIYADDLRFIGPDRAVDEFFERYRDAFSQEHLRRLMGQLPTYMILDDHEIEDDWTMDRFAGRQALYAAAMQAYQCYQMVHGPAFDPAVGTPNHHWYAFRSGRADVFVLDTRSERFLESVPPQMIGATQMRELEAFLLAPWSGVKFVVTSVPFFPDPKARNRDRWSEFDEQRRRILDLVRDHAVPRVVFLTGDVHCSLTAQLSCSTHPHFRVTSIVSSSLYWPYPQGQADSLKLAGPLTQSGDSVYGLTNVGPVFPEDNFCRVSLDDASLLVEFYERKGGLLGSQTLAL